MRDLFGARYPISQVTHRERRMRMNEIEFEFSNALHEAPLKGKRYPVLLIRGKLDRPEQEEVGRLSVLATSRKGGIRREDINAMSGSLELFFESFDGSDHAINIDQVS